MASELLSYYRAGLALLKHVENRQPTDRRFGAEADALWSQFKGELTTADRIDMLIRDADAQWPGAFGGRTVFDLQGVSTDEPFGAKWEGLDGVLAEDIWRAESKISVGSAHEALKEIANSWAIELGEFSVPSVGAADRFVVAGPSAIVALVHEFVGTRDLDWSEQVVVVASPPAHRQLGAAAGGILGLTKGVTVVSTSSSDLSAARASLRGKGARLVMSDDTTPEDKALARELVAS